MEIRDDYGCGREAADVITNPQDNGIFKTS